MPYEHHPSAGELPDKTTQIWRFMSLAKFLSLLTTSSLHFTQVLQLKATDPFEGSLGLPNKQFRELMISDESFARDFMRIPKDHPLPPNHRDFWNPSRESVWRKIFSATTYVNCWHISPHESAFLWSNYSTLQEGVAVRSTVGGLCDCLRDEPRPVYIGQVRYIDYQTEVVPESNAFNPFFCKRRSFQPEQELRACFGNFVEGVGWSEKALTESPIGLKARTDIRLLVSEVLVSPFAGEWCVDAVARVCRALGQDIPVRKSSILDPALF